MATAVLGLIAGVGGTTLGGLLVVWLGRVADRYLSPLLAFAAGVMLSLVVFDMMPSALSASGPVHTCIGAGIGFVAIYVSEKVVRVLERRMLGSQDTLVSIGLTVGAAIGLHNFAGPCNRRRPGDNGRARHYRCGTHQYTTSLKAWPWQFPSS